MPRAQWRGLAIRFRATVFVPVVGVAAVASCSLLVKTSDLSGGPADASGPSPQDAAAGRDVAAQAPDTGEPDTGVGPGGDADATAQDAAPPSNDAGGARDAASDAASEGGSSCDGGIACNGRCVDPARDPNNCNGCGNVCASGSCGASLAADMATMPAGWNFNGAASFDTTAPSAVLTPAVLYQSGSVIFGHAIVVDEFDATFDFRIGYQSLTRCDGMGFMIERQGPTALGPIGSGLGMMGLDGYGVELDIYDNAVCGDANGDHVGIDSLSMCDPSDTIPTSLFASPDLTGTVDLGDGAWHTLDASLRGRAMSVSVDGHPVATNVALAGFTAGMPYYFGFGAGTGGLALSNGRGGFRMEVRSVAISFPTPRCL